MSEIKQAHAGDTPYDENFYRLNNQNSLLRANIVLPEVIRFAHPKNVIDVGCGAGGWLKVWKERYGAEIYGVDGDYVTRKYLMIDEKYFHPMNLEYRINIDQHFDLAECFEVAEHLTPERADSFVEDLTNLSDIILFSAAIPYQGGDNHINEQWQSYWSGRFFKLGYVTIDCIRPRIWKRKELSYQYKCGTVIYAKSNELYRYPELQKYYLENRDNIIMDVVHPAIWLSKMERYRAEIEKLQLQIKEMQGGGYFQTLN